MIFLLPVPLLKSNAHQPGANVCQEEIGTAPVKAQLLLYRKDLNKLRNDKGPLAPCS